MDSQDDKKWRDAFIRFGLDASVGRLFKGIIHNLNGVGQVFSMQAELLVMMFGKADNMLEELSRSATLEEALEKGAQLQDMLKRRAELANFLTGEVAVLQETMQRTSVLTAEDLGQIGGSPFKINSVIMTEMEFLKSDGFFKHKIKKDLTLADNIPSLTSHLIEIHQILSVILKNASQALAAGIANDPAPQISIATSTDGVNIEIGITDNGPGIAADDLEKIFEPFFTTKEGHLGLGLYLARTMALNSGYSLTCESTAGRTCFTLKIPVEGGQLEN